VLHKKDYYEFLKESGEFICTCDHNELKETMEEIVNEQENEHITFAIKKV
jgi:hypothetical protein